MATATVIAATTIDLTNPPKVLKELLDDPVKYKDDTKYRSDDGKEMTLGELRAAREALKPPVESPEAKLPVGDYLEKREERVRKKRGGVRARIDELTVEKKALELNNKKTQDALDEKEAERKKAQELADTRAAEAEEARKKTEADAAARADAKPVRESFRGDADGTKAFEDSLIAWGMRENARKQAATNVDDAAKRIVNDKKNREEFDAYITKGKDYLKTHPDFETVLTNATARGLTMAPQATAAIIKLAAPEVAYWLARPENEAHARRLMTMDETQQIVEVGKIHERLVVSPADFVSSAPPPGRSLGANANGDLPLQQVTDTDEYIRRRRQERRNRN